MKQTPQPNPREAYFSGAILTIRQIMNYPLSKRIPHTLAARAREPVVRHLSCVLRKAENRGTIQLLS
jgi:hypothetical protein